MVWGRSVADDMYESWKKQIFNTSLWHKVRGLAGAVRCELRDAGMQWPAWDTFPAGDTLLDCRVLVVSDIATVISQKS